jgi:hypothetical protein
MANQMDRIEERLDRMTELQAEMNGSLREHMRRTEIAESHIDLIVEELKPVQKHVVLVQGIGTIVLALTAVGAAIATIWQTFGGK